MEGLSRRILHKPNEGVGALRSLPLPDGKGRSWQESAGSKLGGQLPFQLLIMLDRQDVADR